LPLVVSRVASAALAFSAFGGAIPSTPLYPYAMALSQDESASS
jgi:hypothetical protein